jgi:hypothetical protein
MANGTPLSRVQAREGMSVDAKLRLLENDADWLDSRIVREIGELRSPASRSLG